jgi:Tol biopolymer transport system component
VNKRGGGAHLFSAQLEKGGEGMQRIVLLLGSVAALVLAGGVGLLNTVKPAQATFPGVNGRIDYSEDDGFSQDEDCCDDEIYTINPDGTGRRQVTNNNKHDVRPDYSPNGRKIAYAGFDGNDYEIYTVNANGTSRSESPTTPRTTTLLPTRLTASGSPMWATTDLGASFSRSPSAGGMRS